MKPDRLTTAMAIVTGPQAPGVHVYDWRELARVEPADLARVARWISAFRQAEAPDTSSAPLDRSGAA